MQAKYTNASISPSKVRVIAGMVVGKNVNDALSFLRLMPKKGAQILYKVIRSAVANAQHNLKQKTDDLLVKKISINKGMVLKRAIPRSRGMTHPILKRTSNIWVELEHGAKDGKKEPVETIKKEPEAPKKKKTAGSSADESRKGKRRIQKTLRQDLLTGKNKQQESMKTRNPQTAKTQKV